MLKQAQALETPSGAIPRPPFTVRAHTTLHQMWRARVLYLILLPSFLLLAIFSYYPAGAGLYYSLYSWDGYTANFIGIGNFERFFADPAIIQSFKNVFLLLVFSLVTNLTMPMLIAVLIYHLPHVRARFWYRVGYTLPIVVPNVVLWLIWVFMYTNYGGVNSLLQSIGLGAWTLAPGGLPRAWLGDQNTALLAIMFVGFPWVNTVNMLLYLAGFEAIPSEIIDAATVDGAINLSMFFRVELPMILGQVKLIVVLTTISVIQNFQSILVMTQGGPGYATMVPGVRLFNAAIPSSHTAEEPQMGYGSAIGVVLFVIIMIVTIFNMRVFRSGTEYQ